MDFATTTGPVLTQAGSDIVSYGVTVLPYFVTFVLGVAGILFVKRLVAGGIKRI
jgi:hypothetical protein